MKLSIHVNGEPGVKRLQSKFTSMASAIKNRRVMFNRIGVQLLNAVAENFQKQGHEGTPWQALKVATLARRRKGRGARVSSGRILENSGDLRRSFVPKTTANLVRVGTKKIYAPPHEYGHGDIPQRKMLPSRKLGLQTALNIAEGYTTEKLKESKL